jgi:hypothetical protein
MTLIREIRPSDLPFVCDAFWRSQKKENGLPMEKIKKIVNESKVKVLCLQDDEDTILGFKIFNDEIIIWQYIKVAFRNMGLEEKLRSA